MSTQTDEKTEHGVDWSWVERARAAGLDIRVGTGGPMQREPAASFPRHYPSLRERIGERLIRLGEWVRGYSDDDRW
ncbi:MAG TPA: hypothetical protein VJT67_07790 [Longimicrobiaceae bacterium]|nr:hypothetical protein [Longimicrobiaceae bacterium]